MGSMAKIKALITRERSQFLVFIFLSIGATTLTGITDCLDASIFQRFTGSTNPITAALFLAAMGLVLSYFLLSRGWFAIYRKGNLKGLARTSALAALLGLIMILVDVKVVFPSDLNVLFPMSLLFYPAVDFFAQILFHVFPLALLLIVLTAIFKRVSRERIVWICIFVVALIEPVYQTLLGYSNPLPLWALTYVSLHVFLINLVELLVFKRYDFVSMYAFRLVYYLFWHIGWGYFRLHLLF